jgi:putative transposase
MPEHVHLLVSEPERGTLAQAMQSLKKELRGGWLCELRIPFGKPDTTISVWSERKFLEKVRYIHRNPVKRGLVARPEDWAWSSFRHYLSGDSGPVEIESQWTARKREQAGIFPTVRLPAENPRPSGAWTGTLESRSTPSIGHIDY